MHINLIIGIIFILALAWFIREVRAERRAKKAEPADMLKNELEKRRAAHKKAARANERLAALKKDRLAPVLEGVRGMITALPPEDRAGGVMSVREEDGALVLSLKYKGKEEDFALEWDVKNFDLELFAGTASISDASGDYIARLPDGSMMREAEFAHFMRSLSGLIADRLA